jgi:hypothetical protein
MGKYNFFLGPYCNRIKFLKPYGETDILTDSNLIEKIFIKVIDNLLGYDIRIMDPSCGRGPFLIMTYEYLFNNHYCNIDNIEERNYYCINSIWGCDIDERYVNVTIKEFERIQIYYGVKNILKPNIFNCDFLKKEFNVKFDAIIGNPPFQSGKGESGGRTALWRYFVKKGFSLLKPEGILSFVTPQFPNGAKDIGGIFTNNQTLWVNTDIKKYFKEGSTFFTWAVQNTVKFKTTEFINENVEIDITKDNLPNIVSKESISIINKIKSKDSLDILHSEGVNHNKLKKQTDFQSPTYSELYQYKIRRTIGSTFFSFTSILPTYYYNNKITFTKSGKPNFKYHDGNIDPIGAIKHMSGIILCPNLEVSENMLWVFEKSKLSKFYALCLNSGGMNGFNFIRPVIDYTQNISDEIIYSYYELNEEEIKYIESNVG